MEVHHHGGGHSGQKKFKDYFLECLMIFVAVTMGFLAENFREYITEKSNVQELVGQLKADLINDSVNVQKLIDFQSAQIKRADSLYSILIQPADRIDYRKLQDMLVSCDRMDFFYPSTGAITTIKRQLQLKDFVKTKIASHIDNYEKTVAILQAFENRDVEYLGKYIETFLSRHLTPENATLAILRQPVLNEKMRNLEPSDLVQMSVDINLIKAYNLVILNRYMLVKAEAAALIRHLDTTYGLDN